MFLRTIGTFGRDIEETYYTDAVNIGTIEDRGSILKLQGNLVIEFPELAGLGKKDQDELKRWVTLQSDEVEVKFKQRTQLLPRQFILAGTYNPVAGMGWISDPTGGRRFWPVTVSRKVRLDELKADREQLWAEAVHLYNNGHQLFIEETDPVYELLQNEQRERSDRDLWHESIEKIIDDRDYWATSDILEKIGVSVHKQNSRTDKPRVAKVMESLGWSYRNRVVGGKRGKYWCKPESKQADIFEEEIKW
jgi:predicted P-loop ATPase